MKINVLIGMGILKDMESDLTINQGVLKCLLAGISIMHTDEELSDFQAMLLRDLHVLAAQVKANIEDTGEEVPLRDNVVQFKLRNEEDEDTQV